MLEQKISELIDAMKELTAVMKNGKPSTVVADSPPVSKETTKPGKLTYEQVKAAVIKVKESAGKPAAQKIIKEAGKATELAAIKPAQYAAVMKACEAMLTPEPEEEEPETEAEEDPDAL